MERAGIARERRQEESGAICLSGRDDHRPESRLQGLPAAPQRSPRQAHRKPLRKGGADLHRRAEVSQRTDERPLDALAAVRDAKPCSELFDMVARPVLDGPKRLRALCVGGPDEMASCKPSRVENSLPRDFVTETSVIGYIPDRFPAGPSPPLGSNRTKTPPTPPSLPDSKDPKDPSLCPGPSRSPSHLGALCHPAGAPRRTPGYRRLIKNNSRAPPRFSQVVAQEWPQMCRILRGPLLKCVADCSNIEFLNGRKGELSMWKRSWVMAFLALSAAAALSNSASADECAGCNGGCTEAVFFDSPACGVVAGSCSVCELNCYFGLNGSECYCVLFDCSAGGTGGGRHQPMYPIAEQRKPANAESLCWATALRKRSYRAVKLEVFSARS